MSTKKLPQHIDGKPTELHLLFFQYLTLSPSYLMAYRHLFLLENIPMAQIPTEFESVINLCKRAGDVYNISFDQWWKKRGIKLLAPTRKQNVVPFKLDLTLSKKEILKKVEDHLNKLQETPNDPFSEPIYFLTNKIRIDTLQNRYDLVHSKAYSRVNISDEGPSRLPKKPYWKIAIASKDFIDNLGSFAAVEDIKKDLEINRKNKKQIAYLTMLYSKNVKEALLIAENAARGRFPCKDPIKKYPKFDFNTLLDRLTDNLIAEMNEFVANDEVNPNAKLHLKSYKKKLSKREILEKIEFLAEKRARQKLNNPDYI